MSEPDVTVRALVAGHGDFAAGMVSAVHQITGRGDAFVSLSNRDMSAADVERAMREQVDALEKYFQQAAKLLRSIADARTAVDLKLPVATKGAA